MGNGRSPSSVFPHRPASQPRQPGLPRGSRAMAPPVRSAVAPRHRRGSHPPDRTRLPRGPDPLTTVPGARGEPYAVRTRLGWTVNGPVSRQKKAPPSCHCTHGESREGLARLHEKVDRFWRLESTGYSNRRRACQPAIGRC